MRMNPYFDTEKGRFELIHTVRVFGTMPLIVFVNHLEEDKMYLASYSNNSEERYERIYILTPLTDEEVRELFAGKLEVDTVFLNKKEGYRIIVEDEHSADKIAVCNPSDEKYHHIPGHYFVPVEDDLPF